MASQFQIIKSNKIKDLISKSDGIKALKLTQKLGEFYLKIFLENPDVFIARASWFTYYKDYLSQNKIKFDFNVYNEDAKSYATRMVDRQQNISDPELGGQLFTKNDNFGLWIGKTAFAFANFRINQSIRLINDVTTLTSITSSKQDKLIAIKSLAGFAIEAAIFRLTSIATTVAVDAAARAIWDDEEETEEERTKRMNDIYKGQITNSVADILSPVPFTDTFVIAGINAILNEAQEDLTEKERLLLFDIKNNDTYKALGLYGIAASNFDKTLDMWNMMYNKKFKDAYGNTKIISDEDAYKMQSIIVMDLLSTTRLLPADVGNIARKEMGIIMKRGETEKQLKSKSTSKASTLTIEQQIARKEKKIENLDKYINKKMKDKEKELNKKLNRM
jgi:hypothetical protein